MHFLNSIYGKEVKGFHNFSEVIGRQRVFQQYFLVAGVIIACWSFMALLFAPQTYIINLRSATPLSLWQALQANLVLFYAWAGLTPLVLWLGKRLPLERPILVRNLTIHFLASFPVAAVHILIVNFLNDLLFSWSHTYRPPIPLTAIVIGVGATNVMIYWGILAASQALTYSRRYQDREFRLVQTQLQVLKMQLHPHFLFNTLNSISELVHADADRAEQLITQLADLLRLSLNSQTTQEVVLKEELDFLRLYIDIQQTLLQERLQIFWNVAPETLDALVPSMILQPLVENSIRHGIAPRARGGHIKISSYRAQDKLLLNVQDNGIGFQVIEKSRKNGIGLKNVRARLQHLYGNSQELVLEDSADENGISVILKIPFREPDQSAQTEQLQHNLTSLQSM